MVLRKARIASSEPAPPPSAGARSAPSSASRPASRARRGGSRRSRVGRRRGPAIRRLQHRASCDARATGRVAALAGVARRLRPVLAAASPSAAARTSATAARRSAGRRRSTAAGRSRVLALDPAEAADRRRRDQEHLAVARRSATAPRRARPDRLPRRRRPDRRRPRREEDGSGRVERSPTAELAPVMIRMPARELLVQDRVPAVARLGPASSCPRGRRVLAIGEKRSCDQFLGDLARSACTTRTGPGAWWMMKPRSSCPASVAPT